jgi:hypothetical protein
MKKSKKNSQSGPGKRSHFDETDHWQAILENALPLMKRKGEFGYPLLRTRGERDGITAELTLSLEINDCNPQGVPMPVLFIETNTYEDGLLSPTRAGIVVNRRTYNALVATHKREVKNTKDGIGAEKFKLLRRVETHMHERGRLANTFAAAPRSVCRELVKKIEAHNS